MQDNPAFDRYVEILVDPGYIGKTRQEIAEEIGVDKVTLWRWDKKVDHEWVKNERRRRYGQVTNSIDNALIKAAKEGNIRAIEVYYQRFDGYVPLSGSVNLDAKPDDELTTRAQEIIEQLRKGTGTDRPSAGEAQA